MEPHVAVGEAIAHALRRLLSYVAAMLLWLVPLLLVGSMLYAVLEVNSRASIGCRIACADRAMRGAGMFVAVR